MKSCFIDHPYFENDGFRLRIERAPGKELLLSLIRQIESDNTWETLYQWRLTNGKVYKGYCFEQMEKIVIGIMKEFYHISGIDRVGDKIHLFVRHTGMDSMTFEFKPLQKKKEKSKEVKPLHFLSREEMDNLPSDVIFHAYRVMFCGGDWNDFKRFKKGLRDVLFERAPDVEIVSEKDNVIKRIENLRLEVIPNQKIIDSIEFYKTDCLSNEKHKADLVVYFSKDIVEDGETRANLEYGFFKEIESWGDDVGFMVIDYNASDRHRGENWHPPYPITKVSTSRRNPQDLLWILFEPLRGIAKRRSPLWLKKKEGRKVDSRHFLIYEFKRFGQRFTIHYVPPIEQKIYSGESDTEIRRYHKEGETFDRIDIESTEGIALIQNHCHQDDDIGRMVIVKQVDFSTLNL